MPRPPTHAVDLTVDRDERVAGEDIDKGAGEEVHRETAVLIDVVAMGRASAVVGVAGVRVV